MARASLIERNKKKIYLVDVFSKKRKTLKDKIYLKTLDLNERFQLNMKLSKLPRNSSKVRVRNICAVTGRSRGVYRKMGLSRSVIRELASEGMLPGVIKSSW